MELTVKERLILRGVLPEKGDFITFKAVQELHEMLSFNDEEITKLSLKQEEGQITWDSQADIPREFTFNKTSRDVITKVLEGLNERGEIDGKTFSLYDKFIGE